MGDDQCRRGSNLYGRLSFVGAVSGGVVIGRGWMDDFRSAVVHMAILHQEPVTGIAAGCSRSDGLGRRGNCTRAIRIPLRVGPLSVTPAASIGVAGLF